MGIENLFNSLLPNNSTVNFLKVFLFQLMGSCKSTPLNESEPSASEEPRLSLFPEPPEGWVQGQQRIPGTRGETETVYWKYEGNKRLLHRESSFPHLLHHGRV